MATIFSPVHEITPNEFRRVTEVTYLGQVYGTMAALKHMRPRNCGTIVQVGSALSYRAIPLQSAYCGAKFAIRGFTDALRSELKHDASRVRLSMVQLPAVNTPQFDWARSRAAKASPAGAAHLSARGDCPRNRARRPRCAARTLDRPVSTKGNYWHHASTATGRPNSCERGLRWSNDGRASPCRSPRQSF